MKRFLNILGIVLALSIVASSCEKAPFLTLTTPRTINFTDQGGTQSITFTANRDWSVSSSDSWCKVSPSSGNKADGNITITLTCEPNTTYDPRSATLTARVEELSETITVTQDTNLGLLVSPTSYDLTNAAQSIEVEVRANVKYSVEIDAACKDWITQTGTKALSTEKITFSIAANESYDNREGKITIKQTDGNLSETIVVKQSQTNGLFITTPEYDLSNEDHTLSVEVKANVSFQVTPQVDWIKYVETKALTSSTIVLSIEANKTYDDRTGTVLVKQTNGDLSGTITINQKQTDGLFVTPMDVDVDNAEHTVELEVKNNVSYDVVIPDDAKEWISIKSNTATKALADNKVTLAIAQNTTYDNREASITIKQTDGPLAETVTIKQAQTNFLDVTETSFDISASETIINIEVIGNVDFSVDIPDLITWISRIETKGLVSNTVSLLIDENNNIRSRSAELLIHDNNSEFVFPICVSQAHKEIPLNEIWYVSNDGNEINPYNYSFGSQCISNEYDGSKWVLKFDSVITKIGYDAFYNSQSIKEVALPQGIKIIDEHAFYLCRNLEYIRISEGVETIGFGAFYLCTNLQSVILPTSLKTLSWCSFGDCYKLHSINIPEGIESIESATFIGCWELQEIVLPQSVKTIKSQAFENCRSFKEVIIPSQVTFIGERAFNGCSSLYSIYCKPIQAPSLGKHAFEGNSPSRYFYIPIGSEESYITTSGWNDYVYAFRSMSF